MDLSSFVWLVLVIAALGVGFFLGRKRPIPTPTPQPPLSVLETYPVPPEGGSVHFIDTVNNVDVLIQVPQQKAPRALTFQSYTPSPELLTPAKNPTGETIYRLLLGVYVTDDKGAVKHFDPALTTIAKYTAGDLEKANGDPNRLIRLLHDGAVWRRLPMPEASRNTQAMTLTALTESFSECGFGAG